MQSAEIMCQDGWWQRAAGSACRRLGAWVFGFLFFVLVAVPSVPSAAAADLGRFLDKIEPTEIFPGADRLGPPEGDPPVAAAYKGNERVGYVFLNSDFVNSTGYSGKPIRILVALDSKGVIVGAKLVEHHEPIVLVGIPEARIAGVLDGYLGRSVVEIAAGSSELKVDIVSGATVTVMVMDDSILRSVIKVARRYRLGGLKPKREKANKIRAVLDMSRSQIEDWPTLLGDGSVRRLLLTVADINRAFEQGGDPIAIQRPETGDPEDPFIELYAALVSVPTIGRSLLGEAEYKNLRSRLKPGQQAILLAGRGRYSFKGSGYVRGGIFDRFQVIQGDNSVRFRDRYHKRLARLAAVGAPDFPEIGLFRIPESVGFDPAVPWRVELLVSRATGPTSKAFLTFDLSYRTPDKYLKIETPPAATAASAQSAAARATPAGEPLWQKLWRGKIWEIAILSVALAVVTVIFFAQNWLTKRPRLTEWVRIGYLTFTLFGIGFYANAQLSVVNVMTFFNSLLTDFSWNYFLMDPLIFILWFSVAASLMFWGRGAYCGWLCPFGALQELLNKIAKAVKVPQIVVPWWLNERLWPLKYMIFLVLFGASLYSLADAERLAEIEPFKTSIILKFVREWPFVLYSGVLLTAGLFIERFFCRYLCPLGAALAIPGRLRMFEWLLRYKECGSPCQRCANDCMVQAIHPDGHINPNECLYCLNCQVLYHHDQKCPVMIQRRLKRERRAALASGDLSRLRVVDDGT